MEDVVDALIVIGMILTLPLWGPVACIVWMLKNRKKVLRFLAGPVMPKFNLGDTFNPPKGLMTVVGRQPMGDIWIYDLGNGDCTSETELVKWANLYGVVPLDNGA